MTKKNADYYLFYNSEEVNHKISVNDLPVKSNTVLSLETGKPVSVYDNSINFPKTTFPYSVIEIKCDK